MNKELPVMVTGATGYVAGHLIKKLLENGFRVNAAVRDPKNLEKLKYLNKIAEESSGSIEYFKADLLQEASYEEAMKGVQVVFHTASPFTLEVENPQKELIDPALLGTRNVLNSVEKCESVKRVILTSSCAAIYGDNVDVLQLPNQIATENDWNLSSSLDYNPYSYSKKLAEKEAWTINEKQSRWSLVCINPCLVIGPGVNPFGSSESFKIMKQLGDGTFKFGAPDWGMGIVDVRDVAEAHYNAAFNPEANGRYIVAAHSSSFLELAQAIALKYDSYPVPKKKVPKWLLWLIGPFLNKNLTRQSIARNVGYRWKADNSRGIRDLGLNYRSLEESGQESFQQMIDHKVL